MAEVQAQNDLNKNKSFEEANKKEENKNSKGKPRKVKRKRRKKSVLSKFTPFELTAIILGVFIAAGLIAIFGYLYDSAVKSNKAIPKSGLIASDEDDSWMTRVVNSNSALSAEFEVPSSAVTGAPGMKVDSRITKETVELLDDLKKNTEGTGEDVNIIVSYTSVPDFLNLYNSKIESLMDTGDYTHEEAVSIVNTQMAPPGTDEHSTGLLVNFGLGGVLDPAGFKNSQAYQWLKENAWKYGYIERYPEGKESVTLHGADPTSFRYVGKEAAEVIHETNQSLEEYNAAVAQQEAELAAAEAADEAARQEADKAAQEDQ